MTEQAERAEQAEPEALAGSLLESLTQLVTAFRHPRAAGGASASEIAVLMRVRRAGETTAGALARLEGVSPQATSATVTALVQRGLLDRVKDPEDGRRALLRLTDPGRAVLQDRRDQRSATIVAMLAEEFSADERERLADTVPLLLRLAETL